MKDILYIPAVIGACAAIMVIIDATLMCLFNTSTGFADSLTFLVTGV